MSRPTDGLAWPRQEPGDPGAPGADGADGTNGTNGADGADGVDGADGADGVGVPAGGTTGQVLKKTSNTDFDTEWANESGGTLALDDLTDVVAGAPNDGDVLTFDSGSGHWVPAAPTGGGSTSTTPDLNEPPASPSANDDEFTTASLAGIWTQVDTPHASFNLDYDEQGTFLFIGGTGNATNTLTLRQGLVKAAGTAVGITIKMHLSPVSSAPYIEFGIQNGITFGSGSRVLGYIINSTNLLQAAAYDGSNNPTRNLPEAHGAVYLHMQRNTSNLVNVYVSMDGLSWRRYFSQTANWDINYLFIQMHGETSEAAVCRVDWIRVDDARFTQPM